MDDINSAVSGIAIRAALARAAYERSEIRVADPDLAGLDWLATSHRGLFGIGVDGPRTLIHGWFFGICRHHDNLYLFENSAQWESGADLGRIIRFDIARGRLDAPAILVTGLDRGCHQIAVIDGLLCVVDTLNQVIRRFTLDGGEIDVRQPFPIAPRTDTSGAYLHINSIAKVGERIGLILHNGMAEPERPGELAWLDADWTLIERVPLPGRHCHDIVEDEEGRLWHSASRSGEIIRSDGLRIKITDKMTRGIAFNAHAMAVGISTFGPRATRATLSGAIAILDREGAGRREIALLAAPTDVIAL